MLNDLQAETYYDMDRAAWDSLRETATSMPWRMVDAGGVQQAAACIGQGAPTVVYIDGWDSPAAQHWSLAAAQQAESNRVCMFDRPGMGLSPARRGAAPHSTPEQHADEMLDMLAVLGETGPFVLVPWSYGGLVARAAATQRPDQIAGMVLVDASSPLQEGLDEPWQGEDGIVDTDTIASTVGEGPDMGNRPVIVLQAGIEDPETPPDLDGTVAGPATPGSHHLGQRPARRRRRIRPRHPDPQPRRRGRRHDGRDGVHPRQQHPPASLPRGPRRCRSHLLRGLTTNRQRLFCNRSRATDRALAVVRLGWLGWSSFTLSARRHPRPTHRRSIQPRAWAAPASVTLGELRQ